MIIEIQCLYLQYIVAYRLWPTNLDEIFLYISFANIPVIFRSLFECKPTVNFQESQNYEEYIVASAMPCSTGQLCFNLFIFEYNKREKKYEF